MVLGTTKCLHETWDGRFFLCVAVPLVAHKSEMAVRADRLADGHKSFIPKRLGCVP